MKAIVLYGKEDLRFSEVAERPLSPGEVRLRIHAALTCGTDLKVYKRGYHARMIQPPAVFGHEFAGVISEVHPETRGWKADERVVAANSAPCGECLYCRNGQENLCDDLLFLNGAYAQEVVIPRKVVEKNLVRINDQTSFKDAALAEPLACVVLGVNDLHLRKGEEILVIGAGPIGLMFVALAKALGCKVTVAGRGKNRLETAHRLGAGTVLDVSEARNLAEDIRRRARDGFDVVVEAAGKPETWSAAISCARKGGRVNLFGGCPSGSAVTLDTTLMHYSSLTLVSSFHHTPRAFRRALEYIEGGTVRSEEFVDGAVRLSELPQVFQSMAAGNKAVKYFVKVDE